MIESTDRAAYTQYIDQGMGNGLHAAKHKQNKTHKGGVRTGIQRDYYVKSGGCQFLDDIEIRESDNARSKVIVGGTGNVHLTPNQARRFARKMIDMADNIEEKINDQKRSEN